MDDIERIKKEVPYKIIMLCKFGSHLYGTNTPDSDTDYKGIFVPDKVTTLLNRIPKSINNNVAKPKGKKNTKFDVDFELYSLHYFVELALAGDTGAIDMIHANEENTLISTPEWGDLVKHRHTLYSKNLTAFIEYTRKQAAKYGIKGSRVNVAKEFIKLLSNEPDHNQRMSVVWDRLPTNEYAYFIENDNLGIKQYYICGKTLKETITIKYAQGIMLAFHQKFGKRANLAAENEGVDWKALSHALRSGYQFKEILEDGTITFPLKQAPYLIDVKLGKLDYANEVAPALEQIIEEVRVLSEVSDLPDEPYKALWESFILRILVTEYCHETTIRYK